MKSVMLTPLLTATRISHLEPFMFREHLQCRIARHCVIQVLGIGLTVSRKWILEIGFVQALTDAISSLLHVVHGEPRNDTLPFLLRSHLSNLGPVT